MYVWNEVLAYSLIAVLAVAFSQGCSLSLELIGLKTFLNVSVSSRSCHLNVSVSASYVSFASLRLAYKQTETVVKHVLVLVCLFVGWFVCLRIAQKTFGKICIKFSRKLKAFRQETVDHILRMVWILIFPKINSKIDRVLALIKH